MEFVDLIRVDGGCVMRGNDLFVGVFDVMVIDILFGNIFMKVFFLYIIGGDYEV